MIDLASGAGSLRVIAGQAEYLIALGESLLDQPAVEPCAAGAPAFTEDLSSVCLAVAVDVVDSEPAGPSAAGTLLTVVSEDAIPDTLACSSAPFWVTCGVCLFPALSKLPVLLRVSLPEALAVTALAHGISFIAALPTPCLAYAAPGTEAARFMGVFAECSYR
jgi:hypothetical protein